MLILKFLNSIKDGEYSNKIFEISIPEKANKRIDKRNIVTEENVLDYLFELKEAILGKEVEIKKPIPADPNPFKVNVEDVINEMTKELGDNKTSNLWLHIADKIKSRTDANDKNLISTDYLELYKEDANLSELMKLKVGDELKVEINFDYTGNIIELISELSKRDKIKYTDVKEFLLNIPIIIKKMMLKLAQTYNYQQREMFGDDWINPVNQKEIINKN